MTEKQVVRQRRRRSEGQKEDADRRTEDELERSSWNSEAFVVENILLSGSVRIRFNVYS